MIGAPFAPSPATAMANSDEKATICKNIATHHRVHDARGEDMRQHVAKTLRVSLLQ